VGTTGSSPQRLKHFDVELDGFPGPETVAIPMADQLGYFKEAGLSVEINIPAGAVAPIPYLFNDFADLSVTHEPQLVMAREKGVPITAFGSLLPQPTAAMVWLKKSGIESIADLEGKTIATEHLGFQRAFLKTILARAGLTLSDVKVINGEYFLVPALVNGRVDAIFGSSGSVEGVELESRGLNPVITPVQDLGIPDYEELVLVTQSDRLPSEGDEIRAFMSAVTRGAEAAIEDPEGAAEAIRKAGSIHPFFKFNRKLTEAGLEATLPLLSTSGEVDTETAEGLVEWMHGAGLIQQQPPLSNLLTNDYLPDS
jgi:putative hydroxymethylpyrimidine transport system substrate-binding protein